LDGELEEAKSYHLKIAGNSPTTTGSFGPISIEALSSSQANPVIYARNPSFGYIYLAPEPPALTLSHGYVTSSQIDEPNQKVQVYIEITSLGLNEEI